MCQHNKYILLIQVCTMFVLVPVPRSNDPIHVESTRVQLVYPGFCVLNHISVISVFPYHTSSLYVPGLTTIIDTI